MENGESLKAMQVGISPGGIPWTGVYGRNVRPTDPAPTAPLLVRIDQLESENRDLRQSLAQFAEFATGQINRINQTLGL